MGLFCDKFDGYLLDDRKRASLKKGSDEARLISHFLSLLLTTNKSFLHSVTYFDIHPQSINYLLNINFDT